MNAIANGVAFALLQQLVAPEMQGRVFMVALSLVSAMSPLSMAIAGPLADALGIRVLYVVGGLAQIALAIGSFFVPALIHLEEQHPGETCQVP